jgi:hypothetical protein
MNRRTLLKNAAALAVAVPAGAVALTAAQPKSALLPGNPCSIGPTCEAPTYVPPPPDLRTPEQIIIDQQKAVVNDAIRWMAEDYPGKQRFWSRYEQADYTAIVQELLARKIPFSPLQHPTLHGIVVNGNVLTNSSVLFTQE